MKITRIELHKLSLPLIKPYRLAFGTQHSFDTVVVALEGDDGTTGFGEATLLPGYTDETPDESWALAQALAPTLLGADALALRTALFAHRTSASFTSTAFLTALDMMERHPLLADGVRVPLLAILSADGSDRGALQAEVDQHIEAGYGTLKFKVGFDVTADLKATAMLQEVNAGRALLRVDANQGFSIDDARTFVSTVDPADIELVEQTCDKDDWEAPALVKDVSRVPLMLDESISSDKDILRARSLEAADFIKLKLMKFCDVEALRDGLELISLNAMTPILGNGVATDIGCWMEGAAMSGLVTRAGEMNGFLKTEYRLLQHPPKMEGALMCLPAGMPQLDLGAVAKVRQAHETFAAN